MTKVQCEKSNKDLRIRLDNQKIKYEILESYCQEKQNEKDAVINKQGKDIQMLQEYILCLERDCNQVISENQILKEELKTEREKTEMLKERVTVLMAKLSKDSSNSSKPPSTDGFKKVIRSNRIQTGKKPGGQRGHKGHTFELSPKLKELMDSGDVDVEVVEHGMRSDRYAIKYELDIKTTVSIKEHRFYEGEKIPFNLNNTVNYGSDLKALCVYLSSVGLISAQRISDFVADTTNNMITPSKASILSFQKEGAEKLKLEIETIREDILNAPVVCTDETPLKSTERPVTGSETGEMEESSHTTYSIYARTHSTENSTLITVNSHKDIQGVINDGILPFLIKPLIHDHDTKFYHFGIGKHGECNEHILRYLRGIFEITKHNWAKRMMELLLSLLEQKNTDQNQGIMEMDAALLEKYSTLYDEVIATAHKENAVLKEGSAIRVDEKNLFKRLAEFKENHLLFAYDYSVPFTNNMAERDLRWIKTQQKVSGCHRSFGGAVNMAKIHSFISTLKKRNIPLLDALNKVFNGKSVLAA